MSVDKRTVVGILALLITMLVVLGTAGCVGQNAGSDANLPLANNGSWYNYDITNNPAFNTLYHTYNPKDNFYAYANAKSIKQAANPNILSIFMSMMNQGSSHAEQIVAELDAQFDAVSQNTLLTGTEAELVRAVHTMYQDLETREKLGVTPVLPAVAEIRNVSTLEELTALISSGGVSSLKEAFVREAAANAPYDGRVTILEIVPQEFAMTDSYMYRNMSSENKKLYAYLMSNFHRFLERCGYSSDEANATVSAFQSFELALAPVCDNLSSVEIDDYLIYYHPYTYEQLSEMAFPIAGDLKDYYDAGVTRFSVVEPVWLDMLNNLYIPENIEGFKAVMLYNLFMTATPFLDLEMQGMYFDNQMLQIYPYLSNAMEEIMGDLVQGVDSFFDRLLALLNSSKTVASENESDADISSTLFDDIELPIDELLPEFAQVQAETRLTEEYIGMALGKTIIESNVPAGEKEKYLDLVQEIIDTAKDRLMNAGWLSSSTRTAALEKLSKVKTRILYPDDWSYYSYDDVNYQDAGTFYNLSVQLRKHNQAEIIKDALQNPSAAVWVKDSLRNTFILPQTYNAFYNPADNSINIPYGYVSGLIGNRKVTSEEILATAGTTIAHELTHGFDPEGSRFDGDGSYVNWWTETDRKIFNEKEKKIADYFSSFEASPGEYLNGNAMTGEAIADLGGLSIVLDMARSQDNFDYDKFFTVYAQNLYQPVMNALYPVYLNDVHPPGMYRVNVAVQQYDEFYDTYNVTEGDQMYLAPENRLTIW